MKLYLGIWQIKHKDIAPQFIFSFKQLRNRKTFYDLSNYDWIMDSGAFSELFINGKYTYSCEDYLDIVRKYQPKQFFNLDYMCEKKILDNTKLTVREHQIKSMLNQYKISYLLKTKYADIKGRFIGVIQGYEIDEYINHIIMLENEGLLFSKMAIGSICRRNQDTKIIDIIDEIHSQIPNIKLHCFGIKTTIIKQNVINNIVESCDSMAWSFFGRRHNRDLCIKCNKTTKNCANCEIAMMIWYKNCLI